MSPVKQLIADAEKALATALATSLGTALKPVHAKDRQCLKTLIELREYLGIKIESSLRDAAEGREPQDYPPTH